MEFAETTLYVKTLKYQRSLADTQGGVSFEKRAARRRTPVPASPLWEVNIVPILNRFDPGHRQDYCRWPAFHSPERTNRRAGGTGRASALAGAGFTLVEVLLVLATIAVFAAVAAPRYGRASGRHRADLAARRVAADLRLAQSSAKAASASRTVTFSTALKQYQLQSVPSPDGVAGDYTVVLSAEPYKANLASALFNGNPQVVFNGWGLPDYAGTVVISVGSEQRTIVVEAGTGRISIQ